MHSLCATKLLIAISCDATNNFLLKSNDSNVATNYFFSLSMLDLIIKDFLTIKIYARGMMT